MPFLVSPLHCSKQNEGKGKKTHKDKQTKDQKNFQNRPTKYYKEKQIKILQTDITQKQIQGKNKHKAKNRKIP